MKSYLLFILFFVQLNAHTQVSIESGKIYIVSDVRFTMCKQWGDDFSLLEFDQLNSTIFDSLADVFIKNKDQKFQLNYFTGLRGNDSINMLISQKHVEEIKNCLLKRGIDTNQISVLGIGESKPRKIWTIENSYFLEDPKIPNAIIVELSENYISNFKGDKRKYEYLHSLNNRIEIQLLN